MRSSLLQADWKSRQGLCCIVLTLILALPALTIGQGYFGTVSGVLTDSTGAVIPGAKATLIDQEKGYKFFETSDSAGRYLFRSVPPGLYTVVAEMTGFEKTERTGIRVDVSENPTANLSLKVASSAETVEVKSQTQRLDAEDATTGLVVDRRFINDLPLVDRYVLDLTSLTPGVTEADDQCATNCTGTNFISNGSRNSTADVLMDGATITNYEPNGGITNVTYTPSAEAVDELRVEQSNFSAEYGFSGASVVNMVTRSGTNTFHGSGYDFIRNQLTDANNWFNDLYGIPLPPVHRNNFGGTIGGPIFKNKTFFFFDYDGTRQSSAGTYQAGVPTPAERSDGDFGVLCTTQGGTFNSQGECSVAAGQIWDPYTGVYVANQQGAGAVRATFIPYNRIGDYSSPGNPKLAGTPFQLPGGRGNLIDPIAKELMNLFPLPTQNMAGATIYDNWIGSGASQYPNDQYDIKIDHRFSQKNLLSARYSDQWSSAVPFNCFQNFADPCAGGPNKTTAHLFTLDDTHTFTSTLLLTAILGFTRGAERISAYNGDGGVTDPLQKLGFPEYLNSNGFMGVPAIFIDQNSYYTAGYTNIGGDPYGNYKQGQDTGQLTIAVDKVLGNHDMKFGFEGRLHQMNYIQTNAPDGIFSFDRTGTSACPYDFATCGGDGMASFMMGQMTQNNGGTYYEIQDQPATEDHQYAWYVQENWKMNKKLTLNLGLRYDISMPRTDRFNRQNWFDPTVLSPIQVPGLPTLHGGEVFASSKQRTIVNDDWSDIQPRFGFAYQITPMTVVRGGYGIYYSQPRSGATGVAPYGSQGFNQYTSAIVTYKSDGATPYLHLNNPYPSGLIKPPGNSLGLLNDFGYGANGPLRNMVATPYEQSWSFGFERQVPYQVFLTAIYAGKKGTHLYFSGANYINHLGPQVESDSLAQINNLTNMVNNPFYGIDTDPNSSLSAPQIQELNLELPYPQFPGGVTTDAWPIASSTYHSLQLMAEKHYSNGLQFLVTYVWSKSIDDSSVPDDNTTWLGSFTSLQDPNKPSLERSLSTFDIPAVLQFSYLYDLPVGRGRMFFNKMPAVMDEILGGWKTNGIWRIACGRPIAFSTYDGTSIPTYGGQRPNIVAKPRRTGGKDSVWINDYIANPGSIVLPPVYTLGDAPRVTALVRSPLAFNTSLSVEKDFSLSSIHEGMLFELRLEAQNAFNHPVFGTPDTSVDDPNFGIISYTSNNPRQVQLGLKITF